MIRARSTLLIAAAIAACIGIAGDYVMRNQATYEHSVGLSDLIRLDRGAANRFENARGLSPCERDGWEVVRAARGKLIAMGEGRAELLAVTAPTFSEIELAAFRPGMVKVFRFPGQTGFSPPSAEWFSPEPRTIAETRLAGDDYYAITMPIARNVFYAMTAREYGRDGVTYYLSTSTDNCAFSWTPRGEGAAAYIARMLTELSKPGASTSALLAHAAAINRSDESH